MRPKLSAGWILAAIVLILFAGLVSQLEIRTREVERKFSGLNNEPLLAARRFLRRMGIDAHTEYRGWRAWVPSELNSTVIVTAASAAGQARLDEHFASWVGQGGRLVIALGRWPRAFGDEHTSGDRPGDEDQTETEDTEDTEGVAGPHAADVDVFEELTGLARGLTLRPTPGERFRKIWLAGVAGDAEPIEVHIRSGQRMVPAAASDWTVESECVARRRYRAGEVVVLCDDLPIMNHFIGEAEHAEFLWSLTAPSHHAVLITGGRQRGLLTLLWDRAAPGVVAGWLVLVLALARAIPRFGPILERTAPARRGIMEHIDAAGWYLWRHRATAELAAAMQAEVEHLAGRRIPHFALLTRTLRERALRRSLGDTDFRVAAALSEAPGVDPARFIETLRILQRARKKL